MEIPLYLSMTAAEFAQCRKLPAHTAWMACHFSPYSTGLTNIPAYLPKGSLLILNDRTPIHKHDPIQIRQILEEIVSSFDCCAVLLDLQRGNSPEAKEIIKQLLTLPCPVCISDIYAKELNCPVFLPPVPLTLSPEEYLKPWKGREIWLDTALEGAVFTLNKHGCQIAQQSFDHELPFREDQLFCHYRTEAHSEIVQFYLQRTKQDIQDLLQHSAAFGVTTGVGLWQELI